MNAKEEARRLYDLFKGFRITNSWRKSCALKCARELRNATNLEFYNEVITEIEKIK